MTDARFELWEARCRCGGAQTADLRMCCCACYLDDDIDLGCACQRGVMLPKDGPRGTFLGCSLYKKEGCKLTKPWGSPHDGRARRALGEKLERDAAEQAQIRDPFEREWKQTCSCGGVQDLDTFACHRNYKTCRCPSCPQCSAELFLNMAKGGGGRRWWSCSAWKESGCSFKASYLPRAPAGVQNSRLPPPQPSALPQAFGGPFQPPTTSFPDFGVLSAPAAAPSGYLATETTFLTCPYAEKEAAKALGARWEPTRRQWYVPAGKDLQPFARWLSSRPWEGRDAPAIVAPPPKPEPPKPEPPTAPVAPALAPPAAPLTAPPAAPPTAPPLAPPIVPMTAPPIVPLSAPQTVPQTTAAALAPAPAPASAVAQYGGSVLVTHDRHGRALAKPRPPTRREKSAATRGAAHLNSMSTHQALCKEAPTAEEAAAQAMSEGLVMVRSESNQTGYKNVSLTGGKKPYSVTYSGGAKRKAKEAKSETFATAEEAALAYARYLGADASRDMAQEMADKEYNKRTKLC